MNTLSVIISLSLISCGALQASADKHSLDGQERPRKFQVLGNEEGKGAPRLVPQASKLQVSGEQDSEDEDFSSPPVLGRQISLGDFGQADERGIPALVSQATDPLAVQEVGLGDDVAAAVVFLAGPPVLSHQSSRANS